MRRLYFLSHEDNSKVNLGQYCDTACAPSIEIADLIISIVIVLLLSRSSGRLGWPW